ncbi:MAG: cytochrome b N-terminal domain-containing protein [Bacillota bacterium]
MGRVSRWIDERIDLKALRATLLDRKVPGGLSLWHTLGSATLAVFTVQVVTGVILAMYYAPSPDHAYDSIRFLERNVMSGALLRGMHHWGASAMVLLVLAHMIRVFSMGAYKYPREINWLLGVVLLFIVLGFSFTGYLLPWDQKAYWATQVGTNIAGTTPLVGGVLVRLLRGGSQLGAATLTRFYSLHVLLFPLLLGGIVLVHLALVIRQGIAPRPHALEQNAPERTSDAAYPGYYEEHYAKAKAADVRFWPDIVAKDIAVATAVILIIFLLARFAGAGLDAPADPTDAAYIPRPEWYFLPFFQLLKLVPGSMESAVAVGVPAAIVLVLLLLPFFDRRSKRSLFHRPIAGVLLAGTLISSSLLLGAALRGDRETVKLPLGQPLSGVERAGRSLFKAQNCNACHALAGEHPDSSEDTPDAPDLTDVGFRHSSGWMHSFIEEPARFHPDTKMPAFGLPKLSHMEIEELARYLATLRGTHPLSEPPQIVDTFPEPVKKAESP